MYLPEVFEGRSVVAFTPDKCQAALLLDNGLVVSFRVEEFVAGHWFEVFALKWELRVSKQLYEWNDISSPFVIARTIKVWREEWSEPCGFMGQLGSAPYSLQRSGRIGEAPVAVDNLAKVLSGLELQSHDGQAILVCSSPSRPFDIDTAFTSADIEKLMIYHSRED